MSIVETKLNSPSFLFIASVNVSSIVLLCMCIWPYCITLQKKIQSVLLLLNVFLLNIQCDVIIEKDKWKEKLEKTLFILINIRSNEYLEIQQETILYSSYVDDKLMIVIELIKLVSFFSLSLTIEWIVE
jgi:hypothetical protein